MKLATSLVRLAQIIRSRVVHPVLPVGPSKPISLVSAVTATTKPGPTLVQVVYIIVEPAPPAVVASPAPLPTTELLPVLTVYVWMATTTMEQMQPAKAATTHARPAPPQLPVQPATQQINVQT